MTSGDFAVVDHPIAPAIRYTAESPQGPRAYVRGSGWREGLEMSADPPLTFRPRLPGGKQEEKAGMKYP